MTTPPRSGKSWATKLASIPSKSKVREYRAAYPKHGIVTELADAVETLRSIVSELERQFMSHPNLDLRIQIAYEAAERQFREKVAALETDLQEGRELLAVMHGDGGHYTAEHGFAKACRDAIDKRNEWAEKIGTLECERDDLQQAIPNVVPRSRYDVACEQYNELKAELQRVRQVAADEITRLEGERDRLRVALLGLMEAIDRNGLEDLLRSSRTGSRVLDRAQAALRGGEEPLVKQPLIITTADCHSQGEKP